MLPVIIVAPVTEVVVAAKVIVAMFDTELILIPVVAAAQGAIRREALP